MAEQLPNSATAMFEDGSTETWVAAEGVELSGQAIAEFLRVCLKSTPIDVVALQSETVQD